MSSLRSMLLVALSITKRRRVGALVVALFFLAASGLSVAALLARLSLVARTQNLALSPSDISAGDMILWLFLGNPHGLLPEWAAIWAGVLACSLSDPCSVSAQVYVLAGSRTRGWAACCLATVAWSAIPLLALVTGAVATVLLLGGSPTLAPLSIGPLSLGAVAPGAHKTATLLFMANIIVGAGAVSLLQFTLATFFRAPVAYAATSALVLGSSFARRLPLPGSFLMASRMAPFASSSELVGAGSWDQGLALGCFLVIGLASAIMGWSKFSRLDLIERAKQ